MKIAITNHARKRMKERCGINKSSATTTANKAFNEGISFDKAGEKIQKYISKIYFMHHKMGNNIRIYNNTVYIFDNLTLITVFPLPDGIRKNMEYVANAIDKSAEKAYNKSMIATSDQSIECEKMSSRTRKRARIYQTQDGACAICHSKIDFLESSIICYHSTDICVCPICRGKYSIVKGNQHTSASFRTKKGNYDTTAMKNDIINYFSALSINISKISFNNFNSPDIQEEKNILIQTDSFNPVDPRHQKELEGRYQVPVIIK